MNKYICSTQCLVHCHEHECLDSGLFGRTLYCTLHLHRHTPNHTYLVIQAMEKEMGLFGPSNSCSKVDSKSHVPILGTFTSGHGHFDRSVATQPYTQQGAMHYMF